jgi:hypothetical protein
MALVAGLVAMSAFCAPALGLSVTRIDETYLRADGRYLELVFDEGTGLSAQAALTLADDGRSIQIVLSNTSTSVPNDPFFDNPADQLLTSLYVDLGAPGLGADDPRIIGGQVWVHDGSQMVGPANKIKAWDNLSAYWGYGTHLYEEWEFLAPNIVSSMTAHITAFAPGGKLNGPDYGAISDLDLAGGHDAGLPAVSDSVFIDLTLDRAAESLASILDDDGIAPHVEFGSDYDFVSVRYPPVNTPPIPEPMTLTAGLLSAGALLGYLRRRAG